MSLIGLSFENTLAFFDTYLPNNPPRTYHIRQSFSFISNFSEVKSNANHPYTDLFPFEDTFVIYYPRLFSYRQILTFQQSFIFPIVAPFTDVIFFEEFYNKPHIDQTLIFSDGFVVIDARDMNDIFFLWDYYTIDTSGPKKIIDTLILNDSFVVLKVTQGSC